MTDVQKDIQDPLQAYRWLQRVGLRWSRRSGTRAQIIRAALRTAGKVRDAAQLAVAANRSPWEVAWQEEPPDRDSEAPVWILGQILILVAELDDGDGEDLHKDQADEHRTFLGWAEALVCVAPVDEKVEAEAELRGDRQIDRRIQGPEPGLRRGKTSLHL